MDDLFTLRPSGIFIRREAIAAGYEDKQLAKARRSGEVARIRHGAYMPASAWSKLDEVGQHLAKAEAIVATHGTRVAFCNQTAALIHGLDMYGVDLSKVHVHLLGGGAGRTESGIQYHQAPPDQSELLPWNGGLVCAPARAAMEVAATVNVESSLVILDSALRHSAVDMEQLMALFEAFRYRAGHTHLQIAIRLTQPGSGSVGESRSRYFFWRYHIPAPALQVEFRDSSGALLGIVDFFWEQYGVIGEFDGKVKYSKFLRPGETAEDAMFREKQREDRIRAATGYLFFRMVHSDLSTPARTAQRLRETLQRGRMLRRTGA